MMLIMLLYQNKVLQIISASEPTVSDDVNQKFKYWWGMYLLLLLILPLAIMELLVAMELIPQLLKKNSTIISEDISLFYKNGTKFSAIFLDENGKALANQKHYLCY